MTIKEQLHQQCLRQAQEQVDSILQIQTELKEALGSESKSTAGDKHETGRAMIQLEQERAGQQLQQAEQLLSTLQGIDPRQEHTTIQSGSLVYSTRGQFYIAVGLGKVSLEDQLYYVISPTAPLAQALLGKKAGDQVMFSAQEITVQEVA